MPGMQLPAPMEQLPVPGPTPEVDPSVAETGQPAAPERVPAAPVAPPLAVPVPLPTLPIQPVQSPQADVTATTQSASLIADDGDLIEKEWVNKAKQIVERTRDDPYKQSEELTGVKADYMKKRYNKTIKLNK